MNKFSIRRLTQENLSAVSKIHLAAFPESILSSLGLNIIKRYYHWQLTGPHESVAIGIFHENALIGFCFAGNFRGSLSGFIRKNRLHLFFLVITHPWLMRTQIFRNRLRLGVNLLLRRKIRYDPAPTISSKSFGVLSLAINPKFKKLGYGKELMTKIEQIAQNRGFNHLHLTVGTDNLASIGFYEKMGWQKAYSLDENWYGTMVKMIVNHNE